MKLIRFTKTDSKMDKVEYVADSLVLARVENPKQRILPHDFIHALVEFHLGVRGFTDLVFEGQHPRSISADDKAWLSEAMVESIQGMLWSGGPLDFAQFNSWVRDICKARKVPSVNTSLENFTKLDKAIRDATLMWERLQFGSSFDFVWESFAR
jgi:hypothetical protein